MKTPIKPLKFCFAAIVLLSISFLNNPKPISSTETSKQNNIQTAAVLEYIYQKPKSRYLEWVRETLLLNIFKNSKDTQQPLPNNEANQKSNRLTVV